MSKRNKTITVKVKFKEEQLNEILKAANFGLDTPLTVDDVIEAGRWDEFEKELVDTPFIHEIMDGTENAVAFDWMCEFAGK